MHTTTSSTDNVSDFLRNFGPEDSEAKLVRSAIREWLADGSGQESFVNDIELVATELFANAVRASAARESIEMRLHAEDDHVVIEATNRGSGFDIRAIRPPDPKIPGGRGLAIAQALGDVTVSHGEGRTTVRVTCPTFRGTPRHA